MRHRINGRRLNKDSEHRTAMFRNLAAGLFEHGEIRTTLPKARAVQPFVERLITIAKRGTLAARRELESRLNDRVIHAWVADPNVKDEHKENAWFDLPAAEDIKFNRYGELKKGPRLIQHIMTKVAPMFRDRDGGYTRIVKLDAHRLGDGADYVLLQLVGREEGPQVGGRKSTRRAIANRRAAYAAKLRKGAATEAKSEQPVETANTESGSEPAAS
ncbi:MAG: 50S ribosomal protein L17 [Phycisphaeraceae bacterium]|nr:50S ribosomal protein L17 [Phycisphaerales bacterium]QOJ17704.1 MAG: 50S ribosomal protein L17 [Phycisphaeraceae bacterium]